MDVDHRWDTIQIMLLVVVRATSYGQKAERGGW